MPAIEIVEGGTIFDANSEEWNDLFRRSSIASPFQSQQWLKLWSQSLSKPSKLKTIVLREGSDLIALYPMVRYSSPWQALRPAGVGPSDYLGPLQLDSQPMVGETILGVLRELNRKHLVDLQQVPSDHPFAQSCANLNAIEQARCLILDLPDSYEAYVAGLSKSLRYDVRRLEGKALKERNAVVEWATEENANQFADQFFELHKARWKSRGLPGAFFGRNEQFQRTWIAEGVKSGAVIMNSLVCNGRSVGSVYAMKHDKTLYFYQAGMDPNASSLSPGTILVSKMIERAIDLGCTTFDFMRGDEPYKRRWKPTRERKNLRILMPPENVVGKAGMMWNNAAWRVELKVRERLEGKSLRPSKAPKQNT